MIRLRATPKQPRGDLLHRLHQAIGLDEFVEDILQDVFRVLAVGTRRRIKLRSRDSSRSIASEIRWS